jgi:uncharacterized protein YjbJ (UPF0337 family)
MNTSLRDAAESTAHTIAETITETIPALASDAREKIESITPHRSSTRRTPRAVFAAIAVALITLGIVISRLIRTRRAGEVTTDETADDRAVNGNVSSTADRGTRSEDDNGFSEPDTKGVAMSGSADKTKGRIKQAVGDLTDNDEMRREGKVDEAAGKVKDAAKDAVDAVKDKLHR